MITADAYLFPLYSNNEGVIKVRCVRVTLHDEAMFETYQVVH